MNSAPEIDVRGLDVKEGILLDREDAPLKGPSSLGVFKLSGWKALAAFAIGVPLVLILGAGILAIVIGIGVVLWVLRPLANFLFGPKAR